MYAILKTILSSGVIRMIKLLLVEDEKRMNEALAELLRQEGYAVDAMSNCLGRPVLTLPSLPGVQGLPCPS